MKIYHQYNFSDKDWQFLTELHNLDEVDFEKYESGGATIENVHVSRVAAAVCDYIANGKNERNSFMYSKALESFKKYYPDEFEKLQLNKLV